MAEARRSIVSWQSALVAIAVIGGALSRWRASPSASARLPTSTTRIRGVGGWVSACSASSRSEAAVSRSRSWSTSWACTATRRSGAPRDHHGAAALPRLRRDPDDRTRSPVDGLDHLLLVATDVCAVRGGLVRHALHDRVDDRIRQGRRGPLPLAARLARLLGSGSTCRPSWSA